MIRTTPWDGPSARLVFSLAASRPQMIHWPSATGIVKTEILRCPALVEGYVNFGVTTGSGGIRGRNLFDMAAQNRQLLIADNHERDFPVLQVLLVTDAFVGGQQNIETFCLGNGY